MVFFAMALHGLAPRILTIRLQENEEITDIEKLGSSGLGFLMEKPLHHKSSVCLLCATEQEDRIIA